MKHCFTLSYKTKLLLNFTALFAVFTLIFVLFQYRRERQFKRELLEERLRCYANIVASHTDSTTQPLAPGDDLSPARFERMLPPELRLTIIDTEGHVRYENAGPRPEKMSNHLGRPEVQAALLPGEGSDIRVSTTEDRAYFYFAKSYGSRIVRVALPFNDTVQHFMKADNVFLWFVLILFPVVLVLLIYISDRFGKAVSGLKDFMRSADRGLVDYDRIEFPHSELGDIGRDIMEKYRELEKSNTVIANERERLLRHFHCDSSAAAHLGKIAHPANQPVGDAGRTAATAGDLQRAIVVAFDLENLR